MTPHRAAVVLVAAVLLGACTLDDHRDEHTRSTTTTTGPSAIDRAELRAELEWLLSPTAHCPPPPHLDSSPTAEPIGSMLEILGLQPALGLEPAPTPRCPEGDQRP